ncbi:MAG: putative PurR-regulated permease PerM [Verrucomicrobiales bacterium]
MPKPESKAPYPTAFQRKTLWTAVTGVSIVSIGCISVGIVILVARILQFLQPVLVPLAAAGIIAYLIDPLVSKLIAREVPKIRAILVVFSSFLCLIIVLMLSVVPAAIEQGVDLSKSRADITVKAGNYIEAGLLRMERLIKPLILSGDAASAVAEYRLQVVGTKAELPEKGVSKVSIANPQGDSSLHVRVFDSEGNQADGDGTELKGSKTSQLASLKELLDHREKTLTTADEETLADSTTNIVVGALELVGEGEPHWLKAQLKEWLLGHYPTLLTRAWKFISSGLQGFLGVFGYIFGLLLVPVYLFYFLKEGTSIKENWSKYLPLQQSKFKDEVVSTLTEINGYLISFFRGQMLVSMIDGVLIGICLTLIGLPNGLLIGVFVALLGIIPYVGNLLCWIPAVLISIAHFGATNDNGDLINTWGWLPDGAIWPYPLIVTGIFVIVQQINGLVTAPKIVGDSVGLHPLTVIFSVFFWSLLIGGLLGALLAVPLTAALKVLFQRYLWERGIDMWEQRQAAAQQEDAEAAA